MPHPERYCHTGGPRHRHIKLNLSFDKPLGRPTFAVGTACLSLRSTIQEFFRRQNATNKLICRGYAEPYVASRNCHLKLVRFESDSPKRQVPAKVNLLQEVAQFFSYFPRRVAQKATADQFFRKQKIPAVNSNGRGTPV